MRDDDFRTRKQKDILLYERGWILSRMFLESGVKLWNISEKNVVELIKEEVVKRLSRVFGNN